MRINMVGHYVGHARKLSEYLWRYGVENHFFCMPDTNFDLTFVVDADNLGHELFKNDVPVAVWCIGSDVLDGVSDKKRALLERCDLRLFTQYKGRKIAGLDGEIWIIPYDHTKFHIMRSYLDPPTKDVLIYCPQPKYRPLDAYKYIEAHPNKTFTVLGNVFTKTLVTVPDNCEAIRWCFNLPALLARHHTFMSWITEEGKNDHPTICVMGAEALAMGLKVYVNEKRYRYLPKYMSMEVAMPRLIRLFQKLLDSR